MNTLHNFSSWNSLNYKKEQCILLLAILAKLTGNVECLKQSFLKLKQEIHKFECLKLRNLCFQIIMLPLEKDLRKVEIAVQNFLEHIKL
jgi:hypothetical protein